jgi:hypothetical protein
MTIEETALDRVATNLALIAGAISTLAEAVNGTYGGKPIYAQQAQQPVATPTEPAKPRGRGRPPKGGDDAPPAQPAAAPAPAPAETDPFAAPAAPMAFTLEDVRALIALKNATSQENALRVLKDASGVGDLTSLQAAQYGVVVSAAKKAIGPEQTVAPSDDPFAAPASMSAPAAITVEELKALIVATQKRTGADTVQKVVMKHGGKAKNPDTGLEGVSFKALPESAYAAVVAELKALPTTKQ